MLELYNDRLLDLYVNQKSQISSHCSCWTLMCDDDGDDVVVVVVVFVESFS